MDVGYIVRISDVKEKLFIQRMVKNSNFGYVTNRLSMIYQKEGEASASPSEIKSTNWAFRL